MNLNILQNMTDSKILTSDENNRLAMLAQKGDAEAKEKLLSHNLKLIKKLASKYKTTAYSEDDLFQDGVIGMMTAIELFDDQKASFTTYAFIWVKAEMLKNTQSQTSDFHYSTSFCENLRKYERMTSFTRKVEFTDDELEKYQLTRTDVNNILKYKREVSYSLDALSENEFSASLFGSDLTLFVDDDIENQVIKSELQELTDFEIKRKLTPIEQLVISNVFGINCESKRVSELAKELGVSRQYISKIKCNALKKLGKSSNLETYYDF